MSLPLVLRGQVLNEVVVQVAPDGAVAIEAQSLRRELTPLLNPVGLQRLDEAIGTAAFVDPSQLRGAGFAISFNASRLELTVDSIDPSLRPIERIGGRTPGQERLLPSMEASKFSAYLNVNLNLTYRDPRFLAPEIFLFGAARYGGVVVEFDGGFTEDFARDYRFFRRGIRAVYDEPDARRRWSVGDLRLQPTTFLRTPVIGGISVEKSRRIFDPFSPVVGFGGRQIFLDSPSTVEIVVNGAPYQTIELQPGAYSLEDLPIQYGSNDIQLRIRDAAGREQLTRFGYFNDPIDLAPGEDEYSASFGFIARNFAFQPNYTDNLAFLANYRRAISDSLALGGGVQISGATQVIFGEFRVVPQVFPGALSVQAATSFGAGTGFALRAAYRVASSRRGRSQQFTLGVDYQSGDFRTVGDLGQFNVATVSLSATYNRQLTERTYMTLGASYFDSQGLPHQSTFFADVTHRLRPNIRATVGVEYGEGAFFGRRFGVRAGLTVLFGGRRRVDASYESRRDYGRVSFSRDRENYVGSLGYSATAQQSGDNTTVDGRLDYVGNRFDLRVSAATQGDSFGSLTERQTVRMQLGTSLAFAGGTFGIGRPIGDAFLLARPHRTLGDREVIAARNLDRGRYEASSGTFGAGVINRLASYRPQDVQYDVDGAAAGYDIGSGVVRIHPPYRSGYELVAGSNRFVSAIGVLEIAGVPAALQSGTISSPREPDFETQPFFTNSIGRFAIIGLAPGQTYVVRMSDGRAFTIEVPADNAGLYRVGTINLPGRAE